MAKPFTIADLSLGETAIITNFLDEETGLHLMEMGCLPGETVALERIAPLGDPIAIHVSGYLLSLRKQEAMNVVVDKLMTDLN